MKTIKKFKLSLAYDIEKEAKWLTELSSKGFHFFKYKFGFYYFEEDHGKSYIYQTDFQEANEDYFELYKETGWEHVHTEIAQYHYFRGDKTEIGDKRIYSDPASVKGMYQRMLLFYIIIFISMILSQTGLLLTWNGNVISVLALTLVSAVIMLYIYLFIKLIINMKKHENQV